tara:strand:- start:252 stop:698 length:447 start_codon:yes stop_codon:yes gene_type:complete
MIIRKLKEVFTSKSDNITVNMDGGVGGSWKVECAIDEDVVDCEELEDDGLDYEDQYYTGVPAPPYLQDDPWFGPAPLYSQKQLDYMVQETEIKQKEREENFSVESEDIHQRMYEIATQNSPTTVQLNPPGGSENVWMSGTGMGQFNDQ